MNDDSRRDVAPTIGCGRLSEPLEMAMVDAMAGLPATEALDAHLAACDVCRAELAALAVHVIDIAEAMALRVFVPELPALSAKSDRTGDAARMVGTARHLKG